jgi:glycosyltransferase involved in cell wall biosynthesis
MSYQRHTGGRQIRLATHAGGRSLRFTGCSEFISAMGRRAGGTWDAVPNFVEPSRYTYVPRSNADAPLIFLSRIEEIKGAALAIAVARASGRKLILAGNRIEHGAGREYWDREIAPHLGRDGVEWVGEVNDAQKNELLGRAAALIVPIQWDEPFGIVFAEALACGTPILTCARGALPEIVESGSTGLFFETTEEGVAAVQQLASLDRSACRRAAETRFSVDVVTRRYLGLFRQLINASTVHSSA